MEDLGVEPEKNLCERISSSQGDKSGFGKQGTEGCGEGSSHLQGKLDEDLELSLVFLSLKGLVLLQWKENVEQV